MDIESLLVDSSRYTIDTVSEKVYKDASLLNKTLALALAEKGKTSQRTARVEKIINRFMRNK